MQFTVYLTVKLYSQLSVILRSFITVYCSSIVIGIISHDQILKNVHSFIVRKFRHHQIHVNFLVSCARKLHQYTSTFLLVVLTRGTELMRQIQR